VDAQQNTRRRRRNLLVMGMLLLLVTGATALFFSVRRVEKKAAWKTHVVTRGALIVSVIEHGALESSENTRIVCRVRGENTVTWAIKSGEVVKAGDELVRLDTLVIEEKIFETTKYAHWSRAGAAVLGNMKLRSTLAIPQFEQGRFPVDVMEKKELLAQKLQDLQTAKNFANYYVEMAARGYESELQVQNQKARVKRLTQELEIEQTELEVLENYSGREELAELKGEHDKWSAKHAGEIERSGANDSRRDRAIEEFGYCVVKAPRDGLVIYPSVAKWKGEPDLQVGKSVHKDQVLLLMPNLSRMQVTIGIHESIIDRIRPGLPATVTLTDRELDAQVSEVALVARPAGWWRGNSVKYDTVIDLSLVEGLKPGMTAEIEVEVERFSSVLRVPAAALLETVNGYCCWVDTAAGPARRRVQLGDRNELFVVAKSGLQEGDAVILNPLAFIEDAQREAMRLFEQKEAEQKEATAAQPKEEKAAQRRTDDAG
jgi:multidrug efflux pump subunit AcrA (membrane-fusion protein)